MRPAIFFDRDGTLIEDRGYINSINEVVFYPQTFESLLLLQCNYLLFIITNQSGIGKSITSQSDVNNVNSYIINCLKEKNIYIEQLYCCPHTTQDNCLCKKPSAYFIQQAQKDFNLNLKGSYIIGDHPSDVMCGINANMQPIYVLTGHGEKHLHELNIKVPIAGNIADATNYILSSRTIY